jgi:hypothetical protein
VTALAFPAALAATQISGTPRYWATFVGICANRRFDGTRSAAFLIRGLIAFHLFGEGRKRLASIIQRGRAHNRAHGLVDRVVLAGVDNARLARSQNSDTGKQGDELAHVRIMPLRGRSAQPPMSHRLYTKTPPCKQARGRPSAICTDLLTAGSPSGARRQTRCMVPPRDRSGAPCSEPLRCWGAAWEQRSLGQRESSQVRSCRVL